MRIPNICLVLKLDNGKVVSIANEQTESQNHANIQYCIIIDLQKTNTQHSSKQYKTYKKNENFHFSRELRYKIPRDFQVYKIPWDFQVGRHYENPLASRRKSTRTGLKKMKMNWLSLRRRKMRLTITTLLSHPKLTAHVGRSFNSNYRGTSDGWRTTGGLHERMRSNNMLIRGIHKSSMKL